ncbi:hypothetical protein PsYK624_172730 [Phanerochaete sordida]|uniref:Uncharacterized protein n=1 Tax=Phanerochaete sordida TaxID=48140 RepID=A0A9P3GSE9_9APHY|nr:hypothetical protein PsYK624_172730 [Phanerochaete sordida]
MLTMSMTPSTSSKNPRMLPLDDQGHMAHAISTQVRMSTSQGRKIMLGLQKSHNLYTVGPKSGRPRKLDERDLYRAQHEIKSRRAPGATVLQCNMFLDMSPRTIERNVCKIDLPICVQCKKPYLLKKRWKLHREWLKAQEEKKDLEDWKTV